MERRIQMPTTALWPICRRFGHDRPRPRMAAEAGASGARVPCRRIRLTAPHGQGTHPGDTQGCGVPGCIPEALPRLREQQDTGAHDKEIPRDRPAQRRESRAHR